MAEVQKSKTIFEYEHYREFLRDIFAGKKSKKKGFSIRNFSRQAGFQNHSFVVRVIKGERDLSVEAIEKFSETLRLNTEEKQFFKSLVLLNQARTSEEKDQYAKEILKLKSYRRIRPLGVAQYNFFSNWYYVPVRELVALPGFKEEPNWIAKKVRPEITPGEAKQALIELQKLGLLMRNPQGHLVQADRFITTPDEVSSAALAKCHKELMKRASESIDSISREERDISSITLRLSREGVKRAKELSQKFRRDLVELLANDSFEAVYEMGVYLFPLTKLPDGSEGQ